MHFLRCWAGRGSEYRGPLQVTPTPCYVGDWEGLIGDAWSNMLRWLINSTVSYRALEGRRGWRHRPPGGGAARSPLLFRGVRDGTAAGTHGTEPVLVVEVSS